MSNILFKSKCFDNASEVIELVNAFERCRLQLSVWDQKSYLTIAFWYCYLNPPAEARHLFRIALRRYAFENNREMFDESVMLKNLATVQDFLDRNRNSYSFIELVNKLIEDFDDSKWLVGLYTRQLFIAAKESAFREAGGEAEKKRKFPDYF